MSVTLAPSLSVEELLKRNKKYADEKHKRLPPLLQLFGGSFANGPHTLIVACLDSRCNPYDIFNVAISEVIVIRNPGGRVWSAFPDIVALDARFGIGQLVLLQHSDCGTSHLTEELVDNVIASAAEPTSEKTLKIGNEVKQYRISRGKEGVKEDLALLKTSRFLRKELVDGAVGFWMDTPTGLVEKVG